MKFKFEQLGQRKIEILESLRRNRSGLTTAHIVADCIKQPGAETPNDNSAASRNLFQLRGLKLITSFDVTGGKIHALTATGLEVINELSQENGTVSEPESPIVDDKEMEAANAIIDQEHKSSVTNDQEVITLTQGFVLNPDDKIEAAIIEAVRLWREDQKKPVITIDRFDDKVSSLRRLGNLLNDDFQVVLHEIAADFEKISETHYIVKG